MTLDILNAIAQFLQRARLDGSEVQAFNACMAALEAEAKRLEAEADDAD